VALLGIGNESWGCGGSMTPDEYVNHLRVYARYARNFNKTQPMRRIAVGPDGPDTGYTEAVMKAWKNKTWAWDIEGISLHFYTVVKWPPAFKATGFGESEYATLLKDTRRMDELIRTHGAIMDQYDPEKKIALIVDEWGAWLAATPGSHEGFLEQQNSQRDAIIAALNLNTFARHAERVRGANIAQMVNVLQAMIFTDKEKMLLTPTYHVFRLYVPFHDATFLPAAVSAGEYRHGDITLPRIDAIAARDAGGKTWLAIANLDPARVANAAVSLSGTGLKRARGETLSAPRVDSVNTFDAPRTVAPKPYSAQASGGKLTLRLAPASITVVTLE
jgi:alpha-N-arabinofuranosidase